MAVTSNHIVKSLLESETLPTPQKINPTAASPMMLCLPFVLTCFISTMNRIILRQTTKMILPVYLCRLLTLWRKMLKFPTQPSSLNNIHTFWLHPTLALMKIRLSSPLKMMLQKQFFFLTSVPWATKVFFAVIYPLRLFTRTLTTAPLDVQFFSTIPPRDLLLVFISYPPTALRA